MTYEHDDESVDAVVATITLHHLPDFWKQIALCRCYEMLKPGGRLFLADVAFDFPLADYPDAIDEWLAMMHGSAGGEMAAESLTHIRDEFSTWQWIMTGLIERAGFRIESRTTLMPNCFAYHCLKPTGEG